MGSFCRKMLITNDPNCLWPTKHKYDHNESVFLHSRKVWTPIISFHSLENDKCHILDNSIFHSSSENQ
jgi:hypothetical protein